MSIKCVDEIQTEIGQNKKNKKKTKQKSYLGGGFKTKSY